MVSVNTLCKNILNVKNAVIEDCNFFSDTDGVKHIRIRARPNKWHENDCPFCHKPCPDADYVFNIQGIIVKYDYGNYN